MAIVDVIEPGLLTTVQDEGRWGFQMHGVPVAGAMDPWSHRLVNAMVGNPRSAACLEVTVIGPTLVFDDERVIAVAGAGFDVTLDGRPLDGGAAVTSAGSCLRFGSRRWGARAYVGVEGGVDVPMVLGSRATHMLTSMGGLHGRALQSGDRLALGARPSRSSRMPASVPDGGTMPAAARWSEPICLRVLPGPNGDSFTAAALDILQSAPYRVGTASNRMGFRLEGPDLSRTRSRDIITDATPFGALQVPASGQPILLMADRQTTGGYPKLAVVISADISAAAQLAPGDRVSFATCSLDDARAALAKRERALAAFEAGVSA